MTLSFKFRTFDMKTVEQKPFEQQVLILAGLHESRLFRLKLECAGGRVICKINVNFRKSPYINMEIYNISYIVKLP